MTILAGVGYLFVLFLVAGGLLWGWDRLSDWWSRVPPAEQERRTRHFEERLQAPQWEELERHFGAKAPQDLRDLYAGPLLQQENLRLQLPHRPEPDYIASFMPADLATVRDASWVVPEGRFPFADDGGSNFYAVPFLSGSGGPSRVYLHWHEGGPGDVEDLGCTVAEFVSYARPDVED